jgi:hypothetical protein
LKRLSELASVGAVLFAITAPAASADVLKGGSYDPSTSIAVDMPFVQGVRYPRCYTPCAFTATVPPETRPSGDPNDKRPFDVNPNEQWQLFFSPSPGEGADKSVNLGPASRTLTGTLTTPGFVRLYQLPAQDTSEDQLIYDAAESPDFFLLDPADKPAPIRYLSARKGLKAGSIVKIKSPKDTVSAQLTFKRGGRADMRKVKCKKRASGVRCFRIKKGVGVKYPPKATVYIRAFNRKSAAIKAQELREVTDVKRVKVALRCKRVRSFSTGRLVRVCG